jgi:hypothetical protein
MTMNESATRFPLSWPDGWPRTNSYQRQRATFRSSRQSSYVNGQGQTVTQTSAKALTVADAIKRLSGELGRLNATNEVLSTNVKTRLDGLPYSNQPEPADPGAAVYFRLKGKPRCLACDHWNRVADNIAAIAQHIDALRRIDRYGVGTMEQAFAGYAALPPSGDDWRSVFGLNGNATIEIVEAKYRELARQHHPDIGGDPLQMSRLNAARDAARREFA